MSVRLVYNEEPSNDILYHNRELAKIRQLLKNPPMSIAMLAQVLYERMHDIDVFNVFVKIDAAANRGLLVDPMLTFLFTFAVGEKGTIPPVMLLVQIVKPHTSVLEVIEQIPLSIVDNTSMKCLTLKHIPPPVKKNFFAKLRDFLFELFKE